MAIHRKREARRSVRQSGWITLEGGFATRICEVVDLSGTGAKIVIDDPTTLSNRIRLALSRDGRASRACEVVWVRGKSVGLRFTA
jgi:hypothetical protein